MSRPARLVSGIVAAPVEATWVALLAVVPELQLLPPAAAVRTEVDVARHEVAQQGEWWYRGVVTVTAAASGSVVTRAIHNVAPGWSGWLVPFVHHHDEAAFRAAHEALLRAIAERLGCGYVVSGR
jgi:hypothetical protein